jgi:hypothetical protein
MRGRAMDVGVEGNNYYPYNIKDVIETLKNNPIKSTILPFDHHELHNE